MKIHAETMAILNPVGPAKEDREARLEDRRLRQQISALAYLLEGDPVQSEAPPYGKTWNREYNPQPYPEAVPDPEVYHGTGVGLLYGQLGIEDERGLEHAHLLAGWTLVRTGAEVRGRRSKKRG